MRNLCISLAAALGLSVTSANAGVVFQFEGDNGTYLTPTGNIAYDCGTIGVDFCSDIDSNGLSYSNGGFSVTAVATAGGVATTLIQDIAPINSGLGALSEGNNIDDQTQFDSSEAVSFTFDREVFLHSIMFNAGDDRPCSTTSGSEGPCGNFDLFIDGAFVASIGAVDFLPNWFKGTVFKFVANTPGAGFAIAQFELQEVPVPAALPLLISGLAGLGFASRRRKQKS